MMSGKTVEVSVFETGRSLLEFLLKFCIERHVPINQCQRIEPLPFHIVSKYGQKVLSCVAKQVSGNSKRAIKIKHIST